MAEQRKQRVDRQIGFDMRIESEVGPGQVGVGFVVVTPNLGDEQMIGTVL